MRCNVSDVEPASRTLPEHIRRSWICFRTSRLFDVFIPNTDYSRCRLTVERFIPLCFCFPFIRTENDTNFFADRMRREWWDCPRSVSGDHTDEFSPGVGDDGERATSGTHFMSRDFAAVCPRRNGPMARPGGVRRGRDGWWEGGKAKGNAYYYPWRRGDGGERSREDRKNWSIILFFSFFFTIIGKNLSFVRRVRCGMKFLLHTTRPILKFPWLENASHRIARYSCDTRLSIHVRYASVFGFQRKKKKSIIHFIVWSNVIKI